MLLTKKTKYSKRDTFQLLVYLSTYTSINLSISSSIFFCLLSQLFLRSDLHACKYKLITGHNRSVLISYTMHCYQNHFSMNKQQSQNWNWHSNNEGRHALCHEVKTRDSYSNKSNQRTALALLYTTTTTTTKQSMLSVPNWYNKNLNILHNYKYPIIWFFYNHYRVQAKRIYCITSTR